MSSVSKKFKKILAVVAVAAVIWFTAGTASGAMAVPVEGAGALTTTAAAEGVGYSTVATGATAAGEAVTVTTASSAVTGIEGAGLAAAETTGAYGAGAVTPALTPSPVFGAAAPGATEAAASGLTTAAAPAVTETAGGLIGWAQANPALAVVAGSGAFGAYGAYEADKTAKREEERLKRRGLGGVDYEGEYRGKPGLIASQQVQGPEATAAPIVAGQQVVHAGGNRPVVRKNLPQLQKQGLVAQQVS